MTSVRKRKAAISRALLRINRIRGSSIDDMLLWDRARAVGREWSSPDFERLLEEDRRNIVRGFDPALLGPLPSTVEIPEDLPVQRRKKL